MIFIGMFKTHASLKKAKELGKKKLVIVTHTFMREGSFLKAQEGVEAQPFQLIYQHCHKYGLGLSQITGNPLIGIN